MAIITKLVLHDKQKKISNGKTISVTNESIVMFGINGTSRSFTLSFYASNDGTTYYPVMGTKYSDYKVSSKTATETGEAWEFDVGPWSSFQARITAISNGELTVTAVSATRQY